jgi:thiol:disulfide interchange protein DsbD
VPVVAARHSTAIRAALAAASVFAAIVMAPGALAADLGAGASRVQATTTTGAPGAAETSILPVDEAFRFSARVLDDRTIEARFDVADGYYLYRDKLAFAVAPSAPARPAHLPAGVRKHDAFFGDVAILRGEVAVPVAVAPLTPGREVTFKAELQGCAEVGVCYPVALQEVRLRVPPTGARPGPVVAAKHKRSWFQ